VTGLASLDGAGVVEPVLAGVAESGLCAPFAALWAVEVAWAGRGARFGTLADVVSAVAVSGVAAVVAGVALVDGGAAGGEEQGG
jgi:hypothetical protein